MSYRTEGLQEVLLHLPASLRDRAEEMASRECLSLNLFLVMAVAEKLQRLQMQSVELTKHEDLALLSAGGGTDLVH